MGWQGITAYSEPLACHKVGLESYTASIVHGSATSMLPTYRAFPTTGGEGMLLPPLPAAVLGLPRS